MKHLFVPALLVALAGCGGPPSSPNAAPAAPTPVPTTPSLLTPAAGASMASVCSGSSWQFSWSDVQASVYHLQVTMPSGQVALEREDLPATTFTWSDFPVVPESERRGWRFRVQARIGGTWRDWTPERTFDIDPLSPRLMTPAQGAVVDNGCLDFRDLKEWHFGWSACREATRYHLYVIGGTATIPVADVYIAGTTFDISNTAYVAPGNDKGWRWWVQAERNGVWTDPSPPRTFDVEPVNTDCGALGAPTQVSPVSGSVFDTLPRTATFAWQPVGQAASYNFYMEACAPGDTGCAGTTTSYPPVRGLTAPAYSIGNFVGAQPGRWRVSATNAAGVEGTPSPWWTFRFTR